MRPGALQYERVVPLTNLVAGASRRRQSVERSGKRDYAVQDVAGADQILGCRGAGRRRQFWSSRLRRHREPAQGLVGIVRHPGGEAVAHNVGGP